MELFDDKMPESKVQMAESVYLDMDLLFLELPQKFKSLTIVVSSQEEWDELMQYFPCPTQRGTNQEFWWNQCARPKQSKNLVWDDAP